MYKIMNLQQNIYHHPHAIIIHTKYLCLFIQQHSNAFYNKLLLCLCMKHDKSPNKESYSYNQQYRISSYISPRDYHVYLCIFGVYWNRFCKYNEKHWRLISHLTFTNIRIRCAWYVRISIGIVSSGLFKTQNFMNKVWYI